MKKSRDKKPEPAKNPKPATFGSLVKGLREARGISQVDLATCAKIDPALFSKLERGQRKPPPLFPLVFRICLCLGIDEADDKNRRELFRAAHRERFGREIEDEPTFEQWGPWGPDWGPERETEVAGPREQDAVLRWRVLLDKSVLIAFSVVNEIVQGLLPGEEVRSLEIRNEGRDLSALIRLTKRAITVRTDRPVPKVDAKS